MEREQVQTPQATWILKLPFSVCCCVLYCSLSIVSIPPAPTVQAGEQKKKSSPQEIRVVIIVGHHPLGAPSITETFLWMFVGSREMLSQESWVSFPATCPVRRRGFPPNFCRLFLLSTLSSNCHLLGLSLHSQSQFISAPQIMVKPASSPLSFLTQISLSASDSCKHHYNPSA